MMAHTVLANDVIKTLNENSPDLSNVIKALLDQTTELADVFSYLNPCVLKWKMMKKMWLEHVNFIIEIATLTYQGKYTEANVFTNGHVKQMQNMAIMIADGEACSFCSECKLKN